MFRDASADKSENHNAYVYIYIYIHICIFPMEKDHIVHPPLFTRKQERRYKAFLAQVICYRPAGCKDLETPETFVFLATVEPLQTLEMLEVCQTYLNGFANIFKCIFKLF